MMDIRNALYIPGVGFSVSKTKDQSLGSAEADFAALMDEVRAARQAAQASKGTGGAFSRRELTNEEIKELASDYDPTHMTQEEYDSFLDALIERGVLEKQDLRYIDYRGDLIPDGELICVGYWDLLDNGAFQDSMAGGLTWTGASGRAPNISYRPTNANVLAWAKEMSLWKPVGNTNSLLEAENWRSGIFAVLADVLDSMQRKRQ